MEGCIKPSRDKNVRLRQEILCHQEIDVATKEELPETEGIFKEKIEVVTPF